jgi:hypothetical protein
VSEKDIKMTPSHVIPSGVCGVHPLPLVYANQGTSIRLTTLVTYNKHLGIYFILFRLFVFHHFFPLALTYFFNLITFLHQCKVDHAS